MNRVKAPTLMFFAETDRTVGIQFQPWLLRTPYTVHFALSSARVQQISFADAFQGALSHLRNELGLTDNTNEALLEYAGRQAQGAAALINPVGPYVEMYENLLLVHTVKFLQRILQGPWGRQIPELQAVDFNRDAESLLNIFFESKPRDFLLPSWSDESAMRNLHDALVDLVRQVAQHLNVTNASHDNWSAMIQAMDRSLVEHHGEVLAEVMTVQNGTLSEPVNMARAEVRGLESVVQGRVFAMRLAEALAITELHLRKATLYEIFSQYAATEMDPQISEFQKQWLTERDKDLVQELVKKRIPTERIDMLLRTGARLPKVFF